MKYILDTVQKIQKYAPKLRGVFSLADLRNLINPENKRGFYRTLSDLSEAGIICSFCRGFYVTPDFDLQVLSQRICSGSYISFGTVLAANLIIGSVPTYRLRAVKLGPSRYYENLQYKIEQVGISPPLFTGYANINGINTATPEKAFLDTLYYYQKGKSFSFDIYSDIDYNALDTGRLGKYLKLYKNKKFIAFVKGVLNG